MGWLDSWALSLLAPAFGPLGLGSVALAEKLESTPEPGSETVENQALARQQLALLTAGLIGVVAAPAVYAATRKKKLKAREQRTGIALENASQQATGVIMTGLAAPAIATAAAYILVQKLEDAKYITKGLGDATQGLLTVAAAGPAIQGIGGIAQSAFRRGK